MKLLIEDDQGNRNIVPVIRDEITIGRKEGNTIRLTERNVSRRHARLVRHNGKLYVEDVEARYGIKKNGQQIEERTEFGEGDVVLIGDYRLTLRPEQAKNAQPADGEDVAAEISPELHDQEHAEQKLDEEVEQPLEEEPTQVQEADAVEGSPSDESKPAAARSDTQIIETEPAELVVISSNFAGQEFPLDRDEMVIGRGEDCDIIVDHRSVSNTHAKIVRESPESYKIVDLNSRNGVKVGGEEYKSAHLERGDIIELGHVKFRFVEPGENYVFSPQDGADELAVEEGQVGESVSLVVLGAGAITVLVGAIVVYFGLAGDGGTSGPEPDSKKSGSKVAADDFSNSDEKKEPEESKKTAENEKVAEALEEIEKNLENGELEEAIGALKMTRKSMEPSAEQSERIEQLLTEARKEQPYRKRYDSARDALKEGEPQKALEELEKIRKDSVFQKHVEEKNLQGKALDLALSRSRGALDDENYDEAETFANLAAEYDSHADEAKSTLEEIEKAREVSEEDGARAQVDQQEWTGASEERSGGSESGAPPSQGSRPSSGVSTAEARELRDQAKSKVLNGNIEGAISDCRKALQAGQTDCHRIIGLAFKNRGSTSQACRHFGQYVSTSPPDASRIRNIMTDLGCGD